MGAGFDTRCYGTLAKNDVSLFELDQKHTQELKMDFLNKADINTSDVNFINVDFATENWYEKLTNAGYDKDKKTTFL